MLHNGFTIVFILKLSKQKCPNQQVKMSNLHSIYCAVKYYFLTTKSLKVTAN